MTQLAPVAIFAYNRPEHLKKTFSNLENNNLSKETDVFVFSDAAHDDSAKNRVEQVRSYLATLEKTQTSFKSLSVIYAENNKGLATSIIDGATMLLEKYGQVIVLEDDLLTSKDFLEYMNGALEFYQKFPSIWSISGYSFHMRSTENYPHDIFMTGRGCSWGWATWLDRWRTVDWAVKDYGSVKFNLKNRLEFGRWGQDQPFILDANRYNRNHSWAIRWCYSQYKQGKLTVYPKESRIMNAGTDGSGTNYIKHITKYDTDLYAGSKRCVFEPLSVEENIRKEFSRKYMHPLAVLRASIKWTLIKIREDRRCK